MNLNDCGMRYLLASTRILDVNSKNALLQALCLYDKKPKLIYDSAAATGRRKYYLAAKQNEIRQQLVLHKIVSEDGELLPLKPKETVCLPADFDYEYRLSFAGLKTFVACYWMTRYALRAKSFSFECTRQDLADAAHLSRQHLAVDELVSEKLIRLTQLQKKAQGEGVYGGIKVVLLDPEQRSGTSLYDIANKNVRAVEIVPVLDRYKEMFSQLPEWAELKKLSGHVTNLAVTCPFCGGHKKSFRIDTEDDTWYCHSCKSGGNSLRLWGRLWHRIETQAARTGWAAMMRFAPDAVEQEQVVTELMNKMENEQ